MGRTVGGPYKVVNGDSVIGAESGAVIYSRLGNRKFNRVVSSSPATVIHQAQPVPQPTPGPVPSPYPGTADQPGLGTNRRRHKE
ncbi:hypothetical protein [Streptomyces tropicalis]|uniref:Uncharacterized protein n=1 Tax=Streptomyces tropicalis TaxID=3034234 RepID=A0ABT6ABM6_9ACTN|nr:hypothetical protein [Streptomyces tropicalis]MDF3301731.1 hypothetical protein [Streptomyces tropicalis]